MTINIRNYNEHDLDLVVVLLNAADTLDHTERWTSLLNVRAQFDHPGFKPTENAFVAEDGDGRIWGIGWLRFVPEEGEQGFRSSFLIHPMARERGLEDRMLVRLELRAEERRAEAASSRIYFVCSCSEVHFASRLAIERAGMTEARRFWTMLLSDLGALPEPKFPGGLVVRGYQLGKDDEPTRLALNAAFVDHYAHNDETVETFRHMIHSPGFRPDLTLLAEDPKTKTIAGLCLIDVSQNEGQHLGYTRGWIDTLGVRREYRRRGLGEALLLRGLQNLRSAGMKSAVLTVDSSNPTGATRLYSRVGFKTHKTWIAYQKYLHVATGEAIDEIHFAARAA